MSLLQKIRNLAWRASMQGFERGPHITRYYMYDYLASISDKLPNKEGRVLSISHSENIAELVGINATEIVPANYPDHDFIDLQFEDESFDFIFSDQVLEHVEGNPSQAIAEAYRVLKPGGIAIHTTCFINPVHGVPKDFWRYTPEALALLHKDWDNVIEFGGWGNFDVWLAIRDGLRFVGVPHAKWHPYHKLATKNDPEWPIVTWVIAQK